MSRLSSIVVWCSSDYSAERVLVSQLQTALCCYEGNLDVLTAALFIVLQELAS